MFILKCIYKKEFDFLYKYETFNIINIPILLQDLRLKNFISLKDNEKSYNYDNINILIYPGDMDADDEISNVILHKKKELVDMWNELKEAYPTRIGERRLHTKPRDAKVKYIKYLKNGLNHEEVLKALKREKYERKKAELKKEFYPAWKGLSTYVNQKAWETFQTDLENEELNERPHERNF